MSEQMVRKARAADDYDLPEMVAKAASTGELTKAELGELINRRAHERRRADESFARAYVRCFVDGQDVVGKTLFGTYRAMSGPDEGQVAAARALDARTTAAAGEGPLAKLDAMAAELRKADASLTKEQAFTKVLQTPDGMALFRADKERRLGIARD